MVPFRYLFSEEIRNSSYRIIVNLTVGTVPVRYLSTLRYPVRGGGGVYRYRFQVFWLKNEDNVARCGTRVQLPEE
jgi:hypothetical protein